MRFELGEGPIARTPGGARTIAESITDITAGPTLSIIVPTFSEQGNIAELVSRLRATLGDVAWEVIFVDDDSPDGTADLVRRIAAQDHRVRGLRRLGRRGLASACIEGMLASASEFIAVMDADLQHDERLLPQMLQILQTTEAEVVVGSRYTLGGSVEGWGVRRMRMSRLATQVSRLLLPEQLTDPMSGFFMLRRTVFDEVLRNLSAIGFKLLADIFASAQRTLVFRELPYQFGSRYSGESKFSSSSVWEYALLLLDKLLGRIVPARFIAFAIVGTFGVGVHFIVLTALFRGVGLSFEAGQTMATIAAITFNFAVNNLVTYSDRRLRGRRWLRGWFLFSLACSVGALINVSLASRLYQANHAWYLSALAGLMVGAVWNYWASGLLAWGHGRR